MPKKSGSIPVNKMTDFGDDISIEKFSVKDLGAFNEPIPSHRHDRHSFFLIEKGTVDIEIDLQQHNIKAPALLYMHPDQVHHIRAFKNVTVSSWAINNENLNPEYPVLLEGIKPAKPLPLQQDTFSILLETVTLCLKFAERKSDKLYHALVRDSCNALISLVISQYLQQGKVADKSSRFHVVTKAFREILDSNYITIKRPAEYAQMLHLSTAYLNECVKDTTGHSVSHHIQTRIILEAKRLLHYSDQSVKVIAGELGYDDHAYFSRLFTKVTGLSPIAFRNKNPD
jgi:AraC family transcriptional activator of pobA